MIVRIIIILLCLVFFINGCNSLISQFFGTHKLRSFDMAEVAEKGIGDADYVEITNARFEPDFVYQEAEEPGSPPIILYPVFAESSPAQTPALLAWKGYSWESPVIVINENEAPVAWYWNALMMLGAGLVAIGMEAFYNRKKA